MPLEGLLFGAAYGNCAGKVSDARTALRWHPSQVFGYGLALNRTRIDFKDLYLQWKVGKQHLLFLGATFRIVAL